MPTLTATQKVRSMSKVFTGGGVSSEQTFTPHPEDFEYEDGLARVPNAEMLETLEDMRLWRNISGPFDTVEEAMRSLLED